MQPAWIVTDGYTLRHTVVCLGEAGRAVTCVTGVADQAGKLSGVFGGRGGGVGE